MGFLAYVVKMFGEAIDLSTKSNQLNIREYLIMKKMILLASAGVFGMALAASGQMTSTTMASSNATIEGVNGDNGPTTQPFFHNAQVPGNFESFAISSYTFSAGDFGYGSVTGINSAEISYMQSNAFFTSDGPVEFFVSFDTTVGGGDYSGLSHNGTGAGIDDAQFSDMPSMQSLGTGTFTEVADGTVDTYTLDISGVEADLISAINSGNPFSIILGAPSGGTAATYAGIESNNFVGNGGTEPDSKMTNLSLTAVPEPSTYAAVLGLLGLAIVALRRRRR